MKFFESFNSKEDSLWALNGQAFIDYGRLAFEGEGVNQAVLKKPLSGDNWKVSFMVKISQTLGNFSVNIKNEVSKTNLIEAKLKWLESDEKGDVVFSLTNNMLGKPVIEEFTIQDVVTDKWQKVELIREYHSVMVYVNEQRMTSFIWRESLTLLDFNVSSVGEVLLDELNFRNENSDLTILDSISLPKYGQRLNDWTIVSGSWNPIFLPRSRQRVLAQTFSKESIVYHNHKIIHDVTLSVDCRIEQGKIIGLGFYDPETEAQYRIVLEADNSVGLRFESIEENELSLLDRHELSIFPGVWYNVKIKIWNGRCSVFIDNQLIFNDIEVPYQLNPYLMTNSTESALFRNLRLEQEKVPSFTVKTSPLTQENIVPGQKWNSKLGLSLNKKPDEPIKLNFFNFSNRDIYQLRTDVMVNDKTQKFYFEVASGLDRFEFQIVKVKSKWMMAILVKDIGDFEALPVSSDIEKILFGPFNSDLTLIKLDELDLDLTKEALSLSIHQNKGRKIEYNIFANGSKLGRVLLSNNASQKLSLNADNSLKLTELSFWGNGFDRGFLVPDSKAYKGISIEQGELEIIGGTFDDRSIKESQDFILSPNLYEGDQLRLVLRARQGEGRLAFSLQDLEGEVLELGKLSMFESDASVWLDPMDETVGIEKIEGKDSTTVTLIRHGGRVEIVSEEKVLATIDLKNSKPMQLVLALLSGTFDILSMKKLDRSNSEKIMFSHEEAIKTHLYRARFTSGDPERKGIVINKGKSHFISYGEVGDSLEIKKPIPYFFNMSFDCDYRFLRDLNFTQEIKLEAEEESISIKVLQLEKGIELMLSIGGEVKFRKPFLSKLVDFDLLYDGLKFTIMGNGAIIGEESFSVDQTWAFSMKVQGKPDQFIRVGDIVWGEL